MMVFSLRAKFWVRGGVGGQFLRNLMDQRFPSPDNLTAKKTESKMTLQHLSILGSAKARSPQCHSLAQPTGTSPSLSGCKTIASVLSFLVVTVMIPPIQYVG